MKRININLFPKDGYFFVDSDGSSHRSERGWAGVIARVKLYRKRNGFPEGSPEKEVHEQACRRNPNLCTDESDAQVQQTRRVSMKGKLLAWLNKMRKQAKDEPIVFASAEAAKNRSNVCAGCPFNTPISESCSPCRKVMNELRRDLVGARNLDARLTGCLVLNEDLPSSVWIDSQTVVNPELPAHCWRKRNG